MKLFENPDPNKKSRSSTPGLFSRQAKKTPEEVVVQALQGVLDNRFCLVLNGRLPKHPHPFPPVLTGPAGLMLLLPISIKGIFRASGLNWEKMEEGSDKYRPSRPNWIQQGQILANRVTELLQPFLPANMKAEPVLIFTDPASHVDLAQPQVRIIPLTALQRFGSQIMLSAPVIPIDDARQLAYRFLLTQPEDAMQVTESRDAFSFSDEPEKKKPIPETAPAKPKDDRVAKAMERIPLSTRQITILILLAFFLFMLLAGLLIYLIYFQ